MYSGGLAKRDEAVAKKRGQEIMRLLPVPGESFFGYLPFLTISNPRGSCDLSRGTAVITGEALM